MQAASRAATGCPTHLVNEVLKVLVGKRLSRRDNSVHVGLHEIRHDVHVLEVCCARRNGHDVGNSDDVLVSIEMAE